MINRNWREKWLEKMKKVSCNTTFMDKTTHKIKMLGAPIIAFIKKCIECMTKNTVAMHILK